MYSESSDPLICHICMEVYKKPKFLPCFHTFCAHCIQDWASQSLKKGVSTFPCPVCRKDTSLPKGGVNKLQTNFYFSEKELEKVRTGKLCLLHRKKELELFCVPCKEVICLKCKVVDHSSHSTLDLADALHQKKEEVKEGWERIKTTIQTLESMKKEKEAKQRTNQEQLSTAKAVARKVITTAANSVRRFTVNCLQSCCQSLDRHLASDMECLRTHHQEMKALDEQAVKATSCEDVKKLFIVAEELSSGKGSKNSVDKMVKNSNKCKGQPSLYECLCMKLLYGCMVAVLLFISLRSHSGNEEIESFDIISPVPFKMMKQFRCAEEKDTKVYSMCVTNSFVVVSYAQRGLREDTVSESFTRSGELEETHQESGGKAMWSRVGQVCVSLPDPTKTFAKSNGLFRLSNACSGGRAEVLKVVEYHPAVSDYIRTAFLFRIKVGAHRAFDANSKGSLFAVIEEGQSPNLQRTVKIFKRPKSSPIASYVPYNTTFQPMDLCFYKLLDEEVLLVVDEWNHHIHVVGTEREVISSLGYLESGCPPARNPTALTVDHDGNLWVACQGGTIVKTQHLFHLEMNVLIQNTLKSAFSRYTCGTAH